MYDFKRTNIMTGEEAIKKLHNIDKIREVTKELEKAITPENRKEILYVHLSTPQLFTIFLFFIWLNYPQFLLFI